MSEQASQDVLHVRLRRAAPSAPIAVQEDIGEASEYGGTRIIGFMNVPIRPLMEQAADELEALSARVKELEAALKPFAAMHLNSLYDLSDDVKIQLQHSLGDLRLARAALRVKP